VPQVLEHEEEGDSKEKQGWNDAYPRSAGSGGRDLSARRDRR
jgi:hypothetical protein